MNSGIKTRLLDIPSVIGLEPPYLTKSSGKWLVVVKKFQKDQVRRAIDTVINEILFLDPQIKKPGRYNKYNINSCLVTYDAALQKEATLSTIQFTNPPQNAYKSPIRASYDIDNDTSFPAIEEKKYISPIKHLRLECNLSHRFRYTRRYHHIIILLPQ